MYLFDKERTGRNPNFISSFSKIPTVQWKIKLPQFPKRAPESSCVVDDDGNIYFGCHDGCIYSISSDGSIRWQFVTSSKVYSSPILIGDRLYLTCNSSDIICLSVDGKLIWSFKPLLSEGSKKFLKLFISNVVYDYYPSLPQKIKNFYNINCWSSPNLLGENLIICNIFEKGLIALDRFNGTLVWSFNLGFPSMNLSGVAITSHENKDLIIATSQSNGIFCLNENGNLLWKRKLKIFYNSWGNPSIDTIGKAIYCSTSFYSNFSWIFKFDFNGSLIWQARIRSGIRGSISISLGDFIVVPTLGGNILYISKFDGRILFDKKIGCNNMGLWTSAVVSADSTVLINTKTSSQLGSLMHLDSNSNIIWEYNYGKALCTPVLDSNDFLYSGTWDGEFYKFKINR